MTLFNSLNRVCRVPLALVAFGVSLCAMDFGDQKLFAQPAAGGGNPAARRSNLAPGGPAVETNPAVLAILESDPQSLEDMMTAVQQLVQLSRPKLAVILLEKIAAAGAPEDELADLMDRHGAAFFLRLSRDEDIQPAGSQVAELVRDAARARLLDQNRIDQMIAVITGDDQVARVLAMDRLKQHGTLAVESLLIVLADETRSDDHKMLQRALAAFGRLADGPLVGALESEDEGFRARLYGILAERKLDRGVIRMIAPALTRTPGDSLGEAARAALQQVLGKLPERAEAERFLARRLEQELAGDILLPTREDGTIAFWQWDRQQSKPVRRTYSPGLVRLILAAQTSTDLFSLDPTRREYELLYLRSILEASKSLNGLDLPLVGLDADSAISAGSIAKAASTETLLAVYQDSIQTGHIPAAVAVVETLALRGDQQLVISSSGQPTMLLDALRHPNPRLRFAALQALSTLDPQQPFPGSSFFLESLAYFASSRGQPRVLIASGTAFRVQSWGGLLGSLGFASDGARSGKEAFRMAASHPDYSFVLLGDTISRPELAESLSMLRKDPRTAHLPVAIVTDGNENGAGSRLASLDELAVLIFSPTTAEGMIEELRPVIALANQSTVPADVRLQQAQFALTEIARLASDRDTYGFYDFSRHQEALVAALFQPGMAEFVAPTLGAVATPDAIRALLNFSSQNTQSLADRRHTVTALDAAIDRRGLLLTRPEVERQYDLYNASLETEGDETVELLSAILDAIEGPYRKKQEASKEAADTGDSP